ncbi:MAG: acyl--CoA ligase, partial [Desulfobacula sp.]|nr:acyl--CoA ligase [Desulfobacula sp.]
MQSDTLTSLIKDSCHQSSDKNAIQFYRKGVLETRLTYTQLDRETNQMANYFLSVGVKKKDRVILLMEKSVIFVAAHLALQKIGAVSVPLNPGFKASEISYFLEDAAPALVLTGTEQGRLVTQINPEMTLVSIDLETPYDQLSFFRCHATDAPDSAVLPSDPGLIIYTSGTTGKPKG